MKLDAEHLAAIQVLADTVRVVACVDKQPLDVEALVNALSSTDLPCPKRLQRALRLGQLLVETGRLNPEGHGCRVVFDALELVHRHRELFDEAFEHAQTCTGC